MRSILLKGIDRSYKSNLIIHKSLIDKMHYNSNGPNKKPVKLKLLLPKKNLNNIQGIFYPLNIHYKKIIENNNNKKPYCVTESNIDIKPKKNNNYFKKLKLLPKIKENNKSLSKKNIYLASNKFSLNLNSGTSALSCGKISFEKNNINKELNLTKEKKEKIPYMKKSGLKEIIFNQNKSEKRGRKLGNLVRIQKKLNYPKKENEGINNNNTNMNDLIISNDFHGSKIINFEENWKKRFDKLNILVKYKQKNPLNKRSGNGNNIKEINNINEYEKNQSTDTISINKRKHFRSFQNISKINSPKKISKTINSINYTNNNTTNNNTEITNNYNNLHTINIHKYIPRKTRHNNDDIINLLNDSNN